MNNTNPLSFKEFFVADFFFILILAMILALNP